MAKTNYSKFVAANAKRLPPPDRDAVVPVSKARQRARARALDQARIQAQSKKAKKYASPGTKVTVTAGEEGSAPMYNYTTKKKRRKSPAPSSQIGSTTTA